MKEHPTRTPDEEPQDQGADWPFLTQQPLFKPCQYFSRDASNNIRPLMHWITQCNQLSRNNKLTTISTPTARQDNASRLTKKRMDRGLNQQSKE
jgi:hypothetical protein